MATTATQTTRGQRVGARPVKHYSIIEETPAGDRARYTIISTRRDAELLVARRKHQVVERANGNPVRVDEFLALV